MKKFILGLGSVAAAVAPVASVVACGDTKDSGFTVAGLTGVTGNPTQALAVVKMFKKLSLTDQQLLVADIAQKLVDANSATSGTYDSVKIELQNAANAAIKVSGSSTAGLITSAIEKDLVQVMAQVTVALQAVMTAASSEPTLTGCFDTPSTGGSGSTTS